MFPCKTLNKNGLQLARTEHKERQIKALEEYMQYVKKVCWHILLLISGYFLPSKRLKLKARCYGSVSLVISVLRK